MRGKPEDFRVEVRKTRITPAHAGKTKLTAFEAKCGADHPRACGENGAKRIRITGKIGSPPRMRGKLHRRKAGSCAYRITPAHAGKTRACGALFV